MSLSPSVALSISGSNTKTQQMQLVEAKLPIYLAEQNAEKRAFFLVRCSYQDNAGWDKYVDVLKREYYDSGISTQSQLWTTIEDKETLDGATMLQATLIFQGWVSSIGSEEMRFMQGPRYQYYIYVNEESIQSVINPIRQAEKTGNFVILVSLRDNLMGEEEDGDRHETYFEDMADLGDESWKLIDAYSIQSVFDTSWDGNRWYDYSSRWRGPPFVHFRHSTSGEVDLLRYPDPVGVNVYKLLRRIYGKGHLRSRCFEAEEAQSVLQRLRGYAGGMWARELDDFLNMMYP